jgi:hypothetical protein
MTMKRVFSFLFAIILVGTIGSRAQTISKGTKTDTLKASVDSFLNEELNRNTSAPITIHRNFSNLPVQNIPIDTSSLWLQTRMLLNEPINDDPMKSNFKASILNPLSQQFANIESMKTLKYILATVQVGAVGYLAYQHIKKYGFLKK